LRLQPTSGAGNPAEPAHDDDEKRQSFLRKAAGAQPSGAQPRCLNDKLAPQFQQEDSPGPIVCDVIGYRLLRSVVELAVAMVCEIMDTAWWRNPACPYPGAMGWASPSLAVELPPATTTVCSSGVSMQQVTLTVHRCETLPCSGPGSPRCAQQHRYAAKPTC
jgi:hypothetical protein